MPTRVYTCVCVCEHVCILSYYIYFLILYDPMHVVVSYLMADLLTMPVAYAPRPSECIRLGVERLFACVTIALWVQRSTCNLHPTGEER